MKDTLTTEIVKIDGYNIEDGRQWDDYKSVL